MGGRSIPIYCEHGDIEDGGGHLPDADRCAKCFPTEVEIRQVVDDRETIARAFIVQCVDHVRSQGITWELFGEDIGERDWEVIEATAWEIAAEGDPDVADYEGAYGRLAERAEA